MYFNHCCHTYESNQEESLSVILFLAGEVLIWDLSQDDDNFFVCSSKNIELHQEPITKVFQEPIYLNHKL